MSHNNNNIPTQHWLTHEIVYSYGAWGSTAHTFLFYTNTILITAFGLFRYYLLKYFEFVPTLSYYRDYN